MDRARLLRKKATEPERILWRRLRNRNFAGYKFRRQRHSTITSWIFIVRAQKLAIELDGGGVGYLGGNPIAGALPQAEMTERLWR
jgi:very-short-patch-repair endonuclease